MLPYFSDRPPKCKIRRIRQDCRALGRSGQSNSLTPNGSVVCRSIKKPYDSAACNYSRRSKAPLSKRGMAGGRYGRKLEHKAIGTTKLRRRSITRAMGQCNRWWPRCIYDHRWINALPPSNADVPHYLVPLGSILIFLVEGKYILRTKDFYKAG